MNNAETIKKEEKDSRNRVLKKISDASPHLNIPKQEISVENLRDKLNAAHE